MKYNFESGRSMVEILGTLTIIGVLSVGGIAEYSYAIDKYHANETLRDISLRTVDLITQASQGHTELSLAEWNKESTIYDFTNPSYSSNGLVKFDIGATKKIPQNVCQMIFDALTNTTAQIDINTNPANSKNDCQKDNSMTFYFQQSGSNGKSEPEEIPCTPACNANEYCDNGICTPRGCTANDCEIGFYCSTPKSSCTERFSEGAIGSCVALDFRSKEINGTTYYVAKSGSNWWDAAYQCEALGKKLEKNLSLISVEELVDRSNCISDECKRKDLTLSLYDWLNHFYIWTSNFSSNPCHTYDVSTSVGHVNLIQVYLKHGFAICR